MKKLLLLSVTFLAFYSCSEDGNENQTTANESFDLTTILDSSNKPANAMYDNSLTGKYTGVITTEDESFNAKLFINLGNDGTYSAIATTDAGAHVGFTANVTKFGDASTYFFSNTQGSSFNISIVDSKAVITNAFIQNRPAMSQVIKETTARPVSIILGTYVDNNDPSFFGSWNVMSSSTKMISGTTPYGPSTIMVNMVSDVIITRRGFVYSDTEFTDIPANTSCAGFSPSTSIPPFFTGEQTQNGYMFNERVIPNQSFMGGQNMEIRYQLVYSKILGNVYKAGDCVTVPKGIWTWNGRTGSVTLTL